MPVDYLDRWFTDRQQGVLLIVVAVVCFIYSWYNLPGMIVSMMFFIVSYVSYGMILVIQN